MDQVHCEIYIYIYYDKIYVFFIYNEYKIYFLMHRVYLISFEIFSEIFTLISFKYFLSSKKKNSSTSRWNLLHSASDYGRKIKFILLYLEKGLI